MAKLSDVFGPGSMELEPGEFERLLDLFRDKGVDAANAALNQLRRETITRERVQNQLHAIADAVNGLEPCRSADCNCSRGGNAATCDCQGKR